MSASSPDPRSEGDSLPRSPVAEGDPAAPHRQGAVAPPPSPGAPGTGGGALSGRGLLWIGVAAVVVAVLVRAHRLTTQEIVIFCVLIPSIMLHEVAHGWVALAFGDDTAKRAGRLTFNPIAHVDLVGTLIVPALMVLGGWGFFGWAKPVPVNLARLRSPRNQGVLVSLAGPATNVVLAALSAMVFALTGAAGVVGSGAFPVWVQVVFYCGLVNVWLAAFNMIPVPPLDGSVLFERLLPRAWWPGYLRIRPYTMPVLFGLILLSTWTRINVLVSFQQQTFNWWAHLLGLQT